jgi:hypothetical protein
MDTCNPNRATSIKIWPLTFRKGNKHVVMTNDQVGIMGSWSQHVQICHGSILCVSLTHAYTHIDFIFVQKIPGGTMLQTGRSRVRFPIRSSDFSIYLILLAALWPWGRLSLYQKWVPGIFLGVKGGRCVRLTTLSSSVSRLSIENVGASTSHKPCGPSRPVTGIALPFYWTFQQGILGSGGQS